MRHAYLYGGLSICRYIRPSVSPSVCPLRVFSIAEFEWKWLEISEITCKQRVIHLQTIYNTPAYYRKQFFLFHLSVSLCLYLPLSPFVSVNLVLSQSVSICVSVSISLFLYLLVSACLCLCPCLPIIVQLGHENQAVDFLVGPN